MAGPRKKPYLLTWIHTDGDGVPMAEGRVLRLSPLETRKILRFMGVAKSNGNTSDVGLELCKVQTYKKFLKEAQEEALFV